MAPRRLTQDARDAILLAAHAEARGSGERTIQAEHLLLALSAHPALQAAGLDRDTLAQALAREEEHSLAAVGIAAGDYADDRPSGRRAAGQPKLGSSAKVALHNAVITARARGDKRIRAEHLLHGVLAAEHGRFPHALRLAAIDVDDLRTRF